MAPASVQYHAESEAYQRARQAALDARDIIASLEARTGPIESVLLRGARLAQSVRADRVVQWLDWEIRGYNPADSDTLEMMDQTFRRAVEDTAHAICDGLPVIEARMASLREEERRIAEPHLSAARFDAIRREISRLVAIRTAVLAMMHAFASHILAERAHLLEPDERRVVVPAPDNEVSGGDWDADFEAPIDLSGCLEALGAFSEAMENPEEPVAEDPIAGSEAVEDHYIVLEDEPDALIEEDPRHGAVDENSEPTTESLEDTLAGAADTEPANAVSVALLNDETVEPDIEDEWERSAQDETAPPPTSDLSTDILLSDADIEAIFAATEEDIADFDGDDGAPPADPEKDSGLHTGNDAAPPEEDLPTGATRNDLLNDPFSQVDPDARAEVERFVMGVNANALGSIKAAEISLLRGLPGAAPQALRAQRHLIDAVANRVMPPSCDVIVVERIPLAMDAGKPFNRLFAWLKLRIADAESARPLRYALYHHYRRLDPDFYRQSDSEEAEALIDRTFALLSRTLAYLPLSGSAPSLG